jgi:Fe-S-cluster containining protein
MSSRWLTDLIEGVVAIYREADKEVALFQLATGLRCPPLCDVCCNNSNVEASLVEALPLAEEILRGGEEAQVLEAIEKKSERGSSLCLFHKEYSQDAKGFCQHYAVRPLLCRMFGYAGRIGKSGSPEFSPCGTIKTVFKDNAAKASEDVSRGLSVPCYNDFFMRIALLSPALGFKMLPINTAFKEAIEYLAWRKPPKQKTKKAA